MDGSLFGWLSGYVDTVMHPNFLDFPILCVLSSGMGKTSIY